MDVTVCMQDPSYDGTVYLYEAILAAARDAVSWRGLFAFATKDGVDSLFDDNAIVELIRRGGEIDLVVGIDAITDRRALVRIQELEQRYANFKARVFWKETGGLFHPKISDFELSGGGRVVIVGSGNLTPGGLRTNYEAYAVIAAEPGEEVDVDSLRDFYCRHLKQLRVIDEEVLTRAASNRPRVVGGRGRRRPTEKNEIRDSGGMARFDRVLVAQVPKAGGRWAQVHFNAAVMNDYFGLHAVDTERVYLTRVLDDGSREGAEIRPCVYSQANKNYKIEIGAAKSLSYPPRGTRPLLVFRERQARVHDYVLVMPGDTGYGRVLALSVSGPSVGRGLPRLITDTAMLERGWPSCPLLDTIEGDAL